MISGKPRRRKATATRPCLPQDTTQGEGAALASPGSWAARGGTSQRTQESRCRPAPTSEFVGERREVPTRADCQNARLPTVHGDDLILPNHQARSAIGARS